MDINDTQKEVQNEMNATTALNKTNATGLTQDKKAFLKNLIGSVNKKVDLNRIRDEWKNGNR